jgi:flagellar motor switch protein FliG
LIVIAKMEKSVNPFLQKRKVPSEPVFFDILSPMRDRKKGLEAYKTVADPAAKTDSTVKKTTPPAIPPRPAGKATSPGVPNPSDGFIKEAGAEPRGYRKAATLLLMLGKERAAEVLSHFSPGEVEGIIHEIALIKQVDPREGEKVLQDFSQAGQTGTVQPRQGGVETARKILEEAFGPEQGRELFHKYLPFGGETPFAFLNDLEYPQIATLLKEESPRVVSQVISYLAPQKASRILQEMLPEDRKEVVRRIARRDKIDPEIIRTMEDIFRDRIRTQGRVVTQKLDGANALAGILKFMDPRREEEILQSLEQVNPLLSHDIREKIFTIQDILRISDPEFQETLRLEEDKTLALIIKGQTPMIRQKILDNLSERRRSLVEEESLHQGAVRKSEVAEVTREFLLRLREREEKGEILIPRDDEKYI